ncbi:hypothetical protein [Endozoicomonas lisbonensis]|uniref:hypothetical protein n=1 Tax=Endozoicomonas lisbonensis TaxID=3120522 RepID=UPI003396F134
MTRQVHKNCENVCTVYNYGTSIRQARSDSSANQLPAREMLDKFAKAIEELSASQASFPLIESMTESFTRAVEAITTENDLEPEFLQALDQLHTGIQVLTSNMNKVAACCTNAQIIYDERGRLLKKQNKGGRRGRKVVNDQHNIQQNVKSLESVADQLNQYLKPLNDKLESSKQLIDNKRLPSCSQQSSSASAASAEELPPEAQPGASQEPTPKKRQ